MYYPPFVKEKMPWLSSKLFIYLLKLTMAFSFALTLSGCIRWDTLKQVVGEARHTIIIVDRSASTVQSKAFPETIDKIAKYYIQKKSIGQCELCIRYGGLIDEIGPAGIAVSGRNIDIKEARNVLKSLKDPKSQHVNRPRPDSKGTAVCETMLLPAVEFANKFSSNDKVTIVIVGDLVADPYKKNGKTIKSFQKPEEYEWKFEHPKNVAIRFYLVPEDVHRKLKTSWSTELKGVDYRFFEPGHRVQKDHVPGAASH